MRETNFLLHENFVFYCILILFCIIMIMPFMLQNSSDRVDMAEEGRETMEIKLLIAEG